MEHAIIQECGPVTEPQALHPSLLMLLLQADQEAPDLLGYPFLCPLYGFALNSG